MPARSPALSLDAFGDAVWRGDALGQAPGVTTPTGHPGLDAQLPGGGWPVGALSEVLQPHPGQHEWRLLLPALVRSPGPVVLVGPPHVPFGPGLGAQGLSVQRLLWVQVEAPAQRLWAVEQALRCTQVGAVLAWLPQVRAEQLRRLQISAQTHAKLLFVMRPAPAQAESSPAVLRLLLATAADSGDALVVHLLKRRGPPLATPLLLPARPARLGALLALPTQAVGQAAAQRPPHLGGHGALDRLAAFA